MTPELQQRPTSNVISEIAALVPEIGALLESGDVTEVLVNANGSVFTERDGRLVKEAFRVASLDLEPAITRIVYPLHKDFSEKSPLVEARLPDGSRIAAARPPVAKDGISLSIRRFPRRYTLRDLEERRMLTLDQMIELEKSVLSKRNILISGGTGAGKTTLLNALLGVIPKTDRIVTIEDVAEICIEDRENVVQLEAREGGHGESAVTVRDCLRHALRQRPDRIIVGEVRGASAYELLEAWNTGHSGSIATIHADRADTAPVRLRNQAMQAGVLAVEWVQQMIDDLLHLIVHVERGSDGRRKVAEIKRLHGGSS